ncbi:MAG: hypothetical protein ACXWQ5_00215 [Ktedonobacterales bacterium]
MGDVALKLAQIGLEGPYTAGAASVYNGGTPVPATRRLAIEKGMGADFKYIWEAPQEARGTYAGAYQHILQAITASGKIPSIVYCDDLYYYGKMAINGAPTFVTLPNTPISLMAATTQAATMSLTTQPNSAADVPTPGGAFGKLLGVTLSNAANTATSVTIGITGTDIYGKSITESLVFSTGTSTPSATMTTVTPFSSTLYTQNYFKTVTASGITCTPPTVSGNQVAVTGINAFYYTFAADMASSTLYSATMEYWDGSAAWQLPGVVLEKLGLQMQLGKSLKLDTSFLAQKKAQLSAYASVVGGTPGSINPVAPAGAHDTLGNLKDNFAAAASAYKTQVWADPIGNTPGTTAINARLTEFKIDVEVGAKLGKAADGTPYPNFVGRDYYKVSGEMTMLFNSYSGATTDPAELLQFFNAASRTVRVAMPGTTLPCGAVTGTSNWPTSIGAGNYGVLIDLAGKYEEAMEKDVDGRMALSFKVGSEVDLINLGAQTVWYLISRVNPNAL